jgi:hypothetical protein
MLPRTSEYMTDWIGANWMKRLRGQMMSDFLRVMLYVGLPAAIGLGAGRIAMTHSGDEA